MIVYSLVNILNRSNGNNLQHISSKVVFDASPIIPDETPGFTSGNSNQKVSMKILPLKTLQLVNPYTSSSFAIVSYRRTCWIINTQLPSDSFA